MLTVILVCLRLLLAADPSLWCAGRLYHCKSSHSCLNAASQVVSQVGTEGEEQAADYLYRQAQQLAEQAATSRPDLTAEAARESVRGVCLSCRLLLPWQAWLTVRCLYVPSAGRLLLPTDAAAQGALQACPTPPAEVAGRATMHASCCQFVCPIGLLIASDARAQADCCRCRAA